MGGVFGELIWEEIILETDTQEIRVPITARWIKITAPASISENSESLVPKHKEGTQTSEEHRTFKGKSCSLCGENSAMTVITEHGNSVNVIGIKWL